MNPDALDVTRSRLFAGMSPADVEVVLSACERRVLVAGELLAAEGDATDALFLVLSGRIEVFKVIRADVDRVLGTFAAGEVVGAMAFVDGARRSAGARTVEASELAVLARGTFERLGRERPDVAAPFYRNLASIIAGNLRNTLDLYRESVLFGIEATGASAFALKHLVEELRPVVVHLGAGAPVKGRILQMDHGPAGHTLVLKDDAGRISILPYHAIQRIEVG
jgi:CRP-like cAMP-binding protein